MNTVYFIKAICANTKNSFYMRCDLAADDVWVFTYGLKSIPETERGKSSTASSELDMSNSRFGPQYKCPWCGNNSFWKHGKCGNIICWDDTNDNVTCPTCNTNCNLGGAGTITSLNGSANSGQ